jgi:hypothetical protein
MPAVVTDQFRILNASNFVDSVLDETNNSYYVFLGLPNPQGKAPNGLIGFGRSSTWNTNPIPSPVDNLQYRGQYKDTSIFGKKISSQNIRRVVKKHTWTSNTRYDMYRHDYQVGVNEAPNGETGNLYNTNFYVINSDYRVYICIHNGSSPTLPKGSKSIDEPTFTDLEPSAAGTSGDGYIWKYLFTVSPSDIIKFDSTDYIVVPNDWGTTTDSQIQTVREAADSDINKNQLKTIVIKNAGLPGNYTEGTHSVNILGDGIGGKALITVSSIGIITKAEITAGGYGYTYGIVDLGPLQASTTISGPAYLIPVIPPSKGHGYDIYSELGADKVLIYVRFDDSTKDFPTDTSFAQVGIVKNPLQFSSSNKATSNDYSSLYSIKLTGDLGTTVDVVGTGITQSVAGGGVARGYIASYDKDTNVLKYFQDRSLYFGDANDQGDSSVVSTQSKVLSFESTSATIISSSPSFSVSVDRGFSGVSTTTSSGKQINLGVEFTNGLANPEINKKTGDVLYIDNRSIVKRDLRQKEDIKIILEF